MTPIEIVIKKFGSIRAVARAADVEATHICFLRDRQLKEKKGSIPERYHEPLLRAAKQKGIKLSQKELWHKISL